MNASSIIGMGLSALSVFLFFGCDEDNGDGSSSDSDSDAENGAGGGDGDGDAVGGSDSTGSGGARFVPTSAPANWARPADCGGIGNSCNGLGCESPTSTCQLDGGVCIPRLGSRTEEHPYCEAYSCMSFEEASCFCTGELSENYESCESPSAMVGLCAGDNEACTEMACCGDRVCSPNKAGALHCQTPCEDGADCESGCCTDLYDTGVMICAVASACENPCNKEGEACVSGSSTTPSSCCRGSCVVSEDPNASGCRRDCTVDTDCVETGFCQLYSDSTRGFCMEKPSEEAGTCNGVGGPCDGTAAARCCDDLHCVGFEDEAYACAAECTTNADCDSNCCLEINGGEYSACFDASDCL